jgi:hypothetical protein
MAAIRDLAKAFLRPYIERGDSIDEICKGHPASSDAETHLQIGGQATVNSTIKKIGGAQLAVTRFEGKDYFTTFSVSELYREIQREIQEEKKPRQQTLW